MKSGCTIAGNQQLHLKFQGKECLSMETRKNLIKRVNCSKNGVINKTATILIKINSRKKGCPRIQAKRIPQFTKHSLDFQFDPSHSASFHDTKSSLLTIAALSHSFLLFTASFERVVIRETLKCKFLYSKANHLQSERGSESNDPSFYFENLWLKTLSSFNKKGFSDFFSQVIY